MPTAVSEVSWKQPFRVWLVVLTTLFSVEMLLMLLIRYIPVANNSPFLEAIVDSLLLTVVAAPLLWLLLVRPLQQANHLRSIFLSDLFASIEADRRHVARELHDGVGQSLTLLISGLRSRLAEVHDPALEKNFRHLKELAKQSLHEVKRVSLGLRPSLLDDLGLAAALKRLTDDFQEHHAIRISLELDGIGEKRLEETIETAIFRISQEAFANVLNHSQATEVRIRLRLQTGMVQLSIQDNGVGILPEKLSRSNPGHSGLVGMRERAMALGGRLDVQSTIGEGTLLSVSIPISPR